MPPKFMPARRKDIVGAYASKIVKGKEDLVAAMGKEAKASAVTVAPLVAGVPAAKTKEEVLEGIRTLPNIERQLQDAFDIFHARVVKINKQQVVDNDAKSQLLASAYNEYEDAIKEIFAKREALLKEAQKLGFEDDVKDKIKLQLELENKARDHARDQSVLLKNAIPGMPGAADALERAYALNEIARIKREAKFIKGESEEVIGRKMAGIKISEKKTDKGGLIEVDFTDESILGIKTLAQVRNSLPRGDKSHFSLPGTSKKKDAMRLAAWQAKANGWGDVKVENGTFEQRVAQVIELRKAGYPENKIHLVGPQGTLLSYAAVKDLDVDSIGKKASEERKALKRLQKASVTDGEIDKAVAEKDKRKGKFEEAYKDHLKNPGQVKQKKLRSALFGKKGVVNDNAAIARKIIDEKRPKVQARIFNAAGSAEERAAVWSELTDNDKPWFVENPEDPGDDAQAKANVQKQNGLLLNMSEGVRYQLINGQANDDAKIALLGRISKILKDAGKPEQAISQQARYIVEACKENAVTADNARTLFNNVMRENVNFDLMPPNYGVDDPADPNDDAVADVKQQRIQHKADAAKLPQAIAKKDHGPEVLIKMCKGAADNTFDAPVTKQVVDLLDAEGVVKFVDKLDAQKCQNFWDALDVGGKADMVEKLVSDKSDSKRLPNLFMKLNNAGKRTELITAFLDKSDAKNGGAVFLPQGSMKGMDKPSSATEGPKWTNQCKYVADLLNAASGDDKKGFRDSIYEQLKAINITDQQRTEIDGNLADGLKAELTQAFTPSAPTAALTGLGNS